MKRQKKKKKRTRKAKRNQNMPSIGKFLKQFLVVFKAIQCNRGCTPGFKAAHPKEREREH